MKLTTFLLIIALVQASAKEGYAQITLNAKNASLASVLGSIKQQTGYVFFSGDIDLNKQLVDVKVNNVPIDQALDACFKDLSLEFKIADKTVFIKEKPPIIPDKIKTALEVPITITGKVTDTVGTPLISATIAIKGKNKAAITNDNGEFTINAQTGDVLMVSYIGYKPFEFTANPVTVKLTIALHPLVSGLKEVVVNTGYQTLSQERVTGSFDHIDNELYNRRTATDVLSQLDGVASGVVFNSGGSLIGTPGQWNSQNGNKLQINVRGQVDLLTDNISSDPLIVVDNFPYEGDINNLNPEMIESITILKDAAAASIWGARAGNGVIVITTKKGKLNQKMKVDFNSNVTIGSKPDLFKSNQFLNSNDYIGVEQTLFNNSYFDNSLQNNIAVSPVVDILAKERSGAISATDAANQIDQYRNQDVRNDLEKYIYRKSINQQYGLTVRGGTDNFAYALSVGYDKVNNNLVRNGYDRYVINSENTYKPIKNLDITTGITYSSVNVQNNNNFAFNNGQLSPGVQYSGAMLPYTHLAGAQGNHLPIAHNLSQSYIDSVKRLGFLDWSYNPLNELALSDNKIKQNDLVLNLGVKYQFFSFLNLNVQYQDEIQNSNNRIYYSPDSYYARNYVNSYTQVDPSSGALTYPFPQGGILSQSPNQLNNQDVRGQINFNKSFGTKHIISAIAGTEIRQSQSTSYNTLVYGYNNDYGTAITNLDYTTPYNLNPEGTATSFLPSPNGSISISTNRYLSYYSNIGYTYDDRYNFTLSGRKDGANIFGVKTNDKITPLWSAGLGWNINKESFYHIEWLPNLRLRATYGFNGNVYNAAAYLTANYSNSNLTGLSTAIVTSPPNPELRWEKIRNINFGIDFSLKENIISGSIEVYQKKGEDLLEPAPLAPSTGFTNFIGNEASTLTKGMDLILNSKNLDGAFKWQTTLLTNINHNKVLKYDVPQYAGSVVAGAALVGKPISSVFSYKWAGLDPTNGDPEGYLNGKVSKDYQGIINNYNPDSLVYKGSAIPTIFGSLRNTFIYKQFSLSTNFTYKLGYVFRKLSTSTNLTGVLSNPVSDYSQRWQKPGDQNFTSVPSVVFPDNPVRNTFYQYSSVLVENGDLVRFQDINFSYDLGKRIAGKMHFDHLQLFTYINNIGLIWKANKAGIDPDTITGIPIPRTIALGIKANF